MERNEDYFEMHICRAFVLTIWQRKRYSATAACRTARVSQ